MGPDAGDKTAFQSTVNLEEDLEDLAISDLLLATPTKPPSY
jgi:hypothetical protein